jgi:hypothetical protein
MPIRKETPAMPAPRNNTNRKGKKSVDRERIPINLSLSKGNGLLDLFQEYLLGQGIDPTDAAIREQAASWAYEYWGERLKGEIQ